MNFWPLNSYKIGQEQESYAKKWLEKQNLTIIAQNFRCRGGEIDLIAVNKTPNPLQIIFIEVKYRKSNHYGHPMEFVTPQKQSRLQNCAQFFLIKNPQYQEYAMRFDVVSIVKQNPPQWIQNAF